MKKNCGKRSLALCTSEKLRLIGEALSWVILKEVLPNIMVLLLAEFGLRFCFVFLFIAALILLGLGIQLPTADWGSIVWGNATLINYDDIAPLLPAAAIAILTVEVTFVVDRCILPAGLRIRRKSKTYRPDSDWIVKFSV
jgi:peptide/nickel transport system permease protein